MAGQLMLCREALPCQAQFVAARLAPHRGSALLWAADGSLALVPLQPGGCSPSSRFALYLQRGDGSTAQVGRPVAALAWAPDGVLLAQEGSSKILFCPSPLLDEGCDNSSAPVFLFGSQPQGCVSGLLVGPSGSSLLASWGSDGGLYLWDLADGALLASQPCAHSGGVSAACFIAYGQVVTGGADGVVCIWRLTGTTSLQLQSEFAPGINPVCLETCLDVTTGEQLLVVAAADGTVTVWALGRGDGWRQQWELCESLGAAPGPAVSALSTFQPAAQLAVAQGVSVSIYQLQPRLTVLHQQQFEAEVVACSFLPTGQLAVFFGGRNGPSHAILAAPSPVPGPSHPGAAAATAAGGTARAQKHVYLAGIGRQTAIGTSSQQGLQLSPLQQLADGRSGNEGKREPGPQPHTAPRQVQSPAEPLGWRGSPPSAGRAAHSSPPAGRELPRASLPPAPTLQQPEGKEQQQLQQSPQLSRRCGACLILGAGRAQPLGAEPAHPFSASGTQQAVQLASDAIADEDAVAVEPRHCLPVPTVREGVFYSSSSGDSKPGAAQQVGTTVAGRRMVVAEHEVQLAHLETRSERLVRLTRPASAASPAQLGRAHGPAGITAASVAAGESCCRAQQEHGGGSDSTAVAPAAQGAVPSGATTRRDSAPSAPVSELRGLGSPLPQAPAEQLPGQLATSAAVPSAPSAYQHGSTYSAGRTLPPPGPPFNNVQPGKPADTAPTAFQAAHRRPPAVLPAARLGSCPEPSPHAAVMPQCSALQAQAGEQHVSRLSVPQLNSSRLLLAAQAVQPPPATSEEEQRAARIRAATAATTFPPGAALFPQPAGSGLPASGNAMPTEAPTSPGKQLDPKWVAKRQLRPCLEDLWQQPSQCIQIMPVPVAVPLPTPQQVVQRLLGMK